MYDAETPLELLRDDMMKSLEMMWRSVNVKSLNFKDYIEVNVVGLPDKNSQDFPKEVTALRGLLSQTDVDHNRSAKVPASSFSSSSKMFWEAIKENKKLDIPSHQVALARLFCRQRANDALSFVDSHKDYKLLIAEESPRRFNEMSYTLLATIIRMYDHETEMYDAEERDKGRQYMVENLKKVVREDSRELIRKMRRNTSEQFKDEYAKNLLKNMKSPDDDLNYDDKIVDSCVTKFMDSCEDLKVFDTDYLHGSCGELQKDLHSYIRCQILTIKEKRCSKEIELAQQNLKELLKSHEEMTKERDLVEAEMRLQNEEHLKEELEYSWKMVGKQQEHAEYIENAWRAKIAEEEDAYHGTGSDEEDARDTTEDAYY